MKEQENTHDIDRIVDLLTPKASPLMPESIKTNVLRQIKRRRALKNFFTMKNTFSRVVASMTAAAAAIIVAVVTIQPNTARAAEVEAILDRSIEAAGDVNGMLMRINVRTTPNENFAHINPALPFVEHSLIVVRDPKLRWKLEKAGRTVLFDGSEKYMWNSYASTGSNIGFKGDSSTNFEEWFNILIDPNIIPTQEKFALSEGVKYRIEKRDGETVDEVEYRVEYRLGEIVVDNEAKLVADTIKVTSDEIVLTADVKARGDFSNPYLRNSSIEESDTRREIVFDSNTGQLKSLKIFAKVAGLEILVLDLKDIYYFDNSTFDDAMFAPPAGYEWRDITATPPSGRFAGISATEAAGLIAAAIDAGNMEPARETFAYFDFAFISDYFKGAKVVKIGKPFRSGQYAGVFVPFKVRFADGRTKRLNLALRNDNPNRAWLVDGGF